MIDKPILITGCARSGTSLTAGIIQICGGWGGKMVGATRYNKKGQFENTAIRNGIVKEYLRRIGVDPLCQDPLPPRHLEPEEDWKDKVMAVIYNHGYMKGPWFYKGAKMCLMWQLWHHAFPKARWIIVRRKREQIIVSCMKTGFMKNRSKPESWMKWIRIHEQRFEDMHNEGLDIIEINPEYMVKGDFTEMQIAIMYLGLKWNKEAVENFVEPRLWSTD